MPLDIGIGLLLGIFLNIISGLDYQLCLLIGITACLLPDLDFVWQVLTRKYSYKKVHRDGLHYPLLFVPMIGLIGLLINSYIGLVFVLGAIVHFVHDSIGLGWGVKWLYPLKKTSYAFLYRARLSAEKGMPQQLFYSWTDEQRTKSMAKYADPNWIRQIYFRPNLYGAVEYAILVVGVIAAISFAAK